MTRHILEQLQAFRSPNVFNPWRDVDAMDADGKYGPLMRCSRLEAHFDCDARYLLIGEAPGYQGCHFSGVPFTNEKLLLDGAVPRVRWSNRISTRTRPWCEPSATIMWRTLHKLGIADHTVMANAFAWHPHGPGEPHSNRTPTKAEVAAGAPVLREILGHFDGARVIAIGRIAEHTLRHIGITCEAVRHPSMGGATDFANGLEQLCRKHAA